jgi:hypothetical protein
MPTDLPPGLRRPLPSLPQRPTDLITRWFP